MAESKIPVLTEVYQPKPEAKPARQDDPTLGISPELVSRVAAHVRPRLEAEITQSVLESLSAFVRKDVMKEFQHEIRKTQEEIVSSTKDFVDRTKADLKTEIPLMYQDGIELAQANLTEKFSELKTDATSKFDAILSGIVETATQKAISQVVSQAETTQADTSVRILQYINEEMQTFQQKTLEANQVLLQTYLESISRAAQEAVAKEMQDFQAKTIADHQAQLRESFNEEKTEIFNAAAAEIKTTFTEQMAAKSMEVRENFLVLVNGDLPSVQEVLKENIQQILTTAMPDLEDNLRIQLTAELHQLLLKVKFVLPES